MHDGGPEVEDERRRLAAERDHRRRPRLCEDLRHRVVAVEGADGGRREADEDGVQRHHGAEQGERDRMLAVPGEHARQRQGPGERRRGEGGAAERRHRVAPGGDGGGRGGDAEHEDAEAARELERARAERHVRAPCHDPG